MNKNEFLASVRCTTMAWRMVRSEPPTPDDATRFRMEQGREIGVIARRLFPDGILVAADAAESAEETRRLMALDTTRVLFEPVFEAGDYIAKADVILRNSDGWDVFEVKSSFEDSSKVGREHLDDLAYTVMVLRRAGISIKRSSLLLLSRQYRHGHPYDQLFAEVDMTAETNARSTQFHDAADAAAASTLANDMPNPTLSRVCRECEFFKTDCLGSRHDHTVLELPRLHVGKLDRLSAAGTVDITAVPAHIELTALQSRVKAAAASGEMFVDRQGLRRALADIQWPCHYLDFETVSTAMPLYPGHGCHQTVLTQFSVHSRRGLHLPLQHREFLADAAENQERLLAQLLVESVGTNGSIVVYTKFEERQINGLIDRFPESRQQLSTVCGRLVDFHKIIEQCVYHPAFLGSFSLKSVVPALVPDINYNGLAVTDGDNAMAVFARMARGEIEGVAAAREQLLTYCATDTRVMVRLHDILAEMAG